MERKMKVTKKNIEENIIGLDQVSKKKDGSFVVYRTFFYRGNQSSEKFSEEFQTRFKEKFPSETIRVIDSGEKWAPFRGSASAKASSHFYVQFEVIQK